VSTSSRDRRRRLLVPSARSKRNVGSRLEQPTREATQRDCESSFGSSGVVVLVDDTAKCFKPLCSSNQQNDDADTTLAAELKASDTKLNLAAVAWTSWTRKKITKLVKQRGFLGGSPAPAPDEPVRVDETP